ncbi:MAG: 2-C-methyl-D-erythritol 2,4-cyclodiphosphate synthase [Acidobacteria bacterium]|jgi:2-C-methyl-D-erythritol 2,4-cyclodiphosphate synthase|nr:2-C-methyl-D-erythritol 2,4-cyclodiphosphate synthase [Spirochaetota bacterium]MBE3132562.1 2-C-methyl-D-erythritol 2,4-cyclodiphosphate synthase [Acidobacteriota bacterium]
MRIGLGYDIHRLVPGRPLLLGGVEIPSDRGEEGFSDGDALTHALIDALLGPAGLGDIGSNFPPGREDLRGISSTVLLERTRAMVRGAGWSVANVDCVVVLESPRILPYVAEIRGVLARGLDIPVQRVSVKGKTKEGLGPVGEGRAVEAHVVALIEESGG